LLEQNSDGGLAYIEGTGTLFPAFGRATRAFRGVSAILLAWSSVGLLAIDKRYLSIVIGWDEPPASTEPTRSFGSAMPAPPRRRPWRAFGFDWKMRACNVVGFVTLIA